MAKGKIKSSEKTLYENTIEENKLRLDEQFSRNHDSEVCTFYNDLSLSMCGSSLRLESFDKKESRSIYFIKLSCTLDNAEQFIARQKLYLRCHK